MRMNLFEVTIERTDLTITTHVVAHHDDRVAEIVFDNERAHGHKDSRLKINQVDETLPANLTKGLEAMLESAPAGFASYCEPIGWIVHAAAIKLLQLYRVEQVGGEDVFVVAPSPDLAATIYCERLPIDRRDGQLFRVIDGMEGFPAAKMRNLPALLEFGPVGVVDFTPETGWVLQQV